MRKNLPIQISVPQPCSEDWNKMTPQEQGRFCDSCQRCIIDFSTYSDKELYKYIASHEGQKICGRFKASQLNRNISLPPQPHSQLYKWIVAAGLALIITAVPNSPTFAQAPLTVATEQVENNTDTLNNSDETITVSGTIIELDETPVVLATVTVKQYGRVISSAITGIDGSYKLQIPSTTSNNLLLEVNCAGYSSSIRRVNKDYITNQNQMDFFLRPDDCILLGGAISTYVAPEIYPSFVYPVNDDH